MERLSLLWFGAAAITMMLLATGLALFGIIEAGRTVIHADGTTGDALLKSVGYLIIAIAIFEVARYILVEEVIRERELRHVAEVRRSLTRFISTIIIVVLLESIVAVFKVTLNDISSMLYPVLLLFAGIGMLLGLGGFQWLAASVERKIGAEDDAEDGVDRPSTTRPIRNGPQP